MINVFFLTKECVKDFIRNAGLLQRDLPMKKEEDDVHLGHTMNWLRRACEQGKGGVSSHYSLLSGRWLNPFPETTGYIIPTFYDYAKHSADERYSEIAEDLTTWLIRVQLPNGACVQGSYRNTKQEYNPLIFNTGQNIFGFLRTYHETGEEKFLEAAKRAGEFLIGHIDRNGIWNKFLHHYIPHTYNSRTAWALLELYQVVSNDNYRDVAVSNLSWILSQQSENGWFRNANFKPDELPNTHGIAYTIRGLLESYFLTNDSLYLNSAARTADVLMDLFVSKKLLYTFWDENWSNHGKYFKRMTGKYICLTGNIQLSIVWMKLYEITGNLGYLESAFRMLNFIKTLQNIKIKKKGIRGGIKGAFPTYGSYSMFKYPNWAAKFFADALMMKMRLKGKIEHNSLHNRGSC